MRLDLFSLDGKEDRLSQMMSDAGQASPWWELVKGAGERAADLVHLGEVVEEPQCSAGLTVERLIGRKFKKLQERREASTSSRFAPQECIRHSIFSMLFPWSSRNPMVLSDPPGSLSLAIDFLLLCPSYTTVGNRNGKEHSLTPEAHWPLPVLLPSPAV